MPPLEAGASVRAFYHMNDSNHGYRFVRLPDSMPEETPEGSPFVVGMSTGWVPATVVEPWRPAAPDATVHVRLHGHFVDPWLKADSHGHPSNPSHAWALPRSLVKSRDEPAVKIELALLVVRWWDYWNKRNKVSRTYNILNEDLILDVLDNKGTPHEAFGKEGRYQVLTAFVVNSFDLSLITEKHVKSLKRWSTRQAGLYFLWPQQVHDLETRRVQEDAKSSTYAGLVTEESLFELMQRMEDAGVQSMWPHSSRLYRQLCGKLYLPHVSQDRPELCVPLTVAVDVASQADTPQAAAELALNRLLELKGMRLDAATTFRGVAKRGFCWMGTHVKPFTGRDELNEVVKELRGEDSTATLYIQELVEGVLCELRVICVRDLAAGPEAVMKEVVWMELKGETSRGSGFQLASHKTIPTNVVAERVCGGSEEAKSYLEQRAKAAVDSWLAWLRGSDFGTPVNCRFDFLVAPRAREAIPSKEPPAAKPLQLWLVELTECGSSLCGLSHTPRTVALLNVLMQGADADGRFPAPLPSLTPSPEARNSGGQSRYAERDYPRDVVNRNPSNGFRPGRRKIATKPRPAFPVAGAVVVAAAAILVLIRKGTVQAVRNELARLLQVVLLRIRH